MTYLKQTRNNRIKIDIQQKNTKRILLPEKDIYMNNRNYKWPNKSSTLNIIQIQFGNYICY